MFPEGQQEMAFISNRNQPPIKRFLFAWTIISLFILPGLLWPYILSKKLSSDVQIEIPFLVAAFCLSFALGIGTLMGLKSASVGSGLTGNKVGKVLSDPQVFDLLIAFLVHILFVSLAGAVLINLRLLLVDDMGRLPIWIWCFVPALLAFAMLAVIRMDRPLIQALKEIKIVQLLKRVFNFDAFLDAFSFILSALIGLGMAQWIVLLFRSQGDLVGSVNIQVVLSVLLPFVIYDLILLISILGRRQIGLSKASFLEGNHSWNGGVKKFQHLASSHPWLTSLVATFSLFLFCLVVFRVGYGVNDDIQIIAVASGYLGGSPLPFLTYSNVILGFLLKFLYQLHTRLNWEIWLFLVVHFMSVWGMTYLILSLNPMRRMLRMLSLLMVFSGEAYFLLNLTYTTVSAVASIAGFCLILTALQSDKIKFDPSIIWGGSLILVASLIRMEALEFVALIVLPILILNFRRFNPNRLLIYLGLTGLFVLGAYIFNKVYLGFSPEWDSYYTYTVTRQMLQDTPRLANVDDVIKDVNWSANDLNVFLHWFFPDPAVYSLQNLRFLVDHVSDKNVNIFRWIFFLPDRFSGLGFLPYVLMLFSLWSCMLLYGADLKETLLISAVSIILVLAAIIYLEWTHKTPDRILLFSLWAGIIFSLLNWLWVDARRLEKSPLSTLNVVRFRIGFLSVFFSVVAIASVVIQQSVQTSQLNGNRQMAYEQVLADIRTLQKKGSLSQKALIVSAAYGIPWEWSNPLFLYYPDLQYLPTNWETFSPAYNDVLREFKIQSLPVSLFTNRNVYLMVDTLTMRGIVQFIKEHEGVNVDAKAIYTIPGQYTRGTVYQGVKLFKLEPAP